MYFYDATLQYDGDSGGGQFRLQNNPIAKYAELVDLD